MVALRIELDAADLAGRIYDRGMTAMQNPSILDWRLSPSSFSVAGAVLVGESGCETILPANLATQQSRFHQVVRSTFRRHQNDTGRFQLGYLLEYLTEWFSVGHSLGQYVERGRLISTRFKERAALHHFGSTCGSRAHCYGHLTEQI
jgi:hypothetical protein